MITWRPPNHARHYTRSPPLFSLSPSFRRPLCHVNRGEKFMSRLATTFPRRLLSGSHFVYVRIVAGTMARAATIMRPPPIRLALPARYAFAYFMADSVARAPPPLKLSTVSSRPNVCRFFFRLLLLQGFVSSVC